MKNNKKRVEERKIIQNISSKEGEAFQNLQVNIELISINKKINVIGVTSTSKNEGKSTVLVNLANIYAKKNKRVIILDLDLREPSIHTYFKNENKVGLVDYITGQLSFDNLIQTSDLGIDYINVGKTTPFPAEILESKKLGELIEKLKTEYDFVFLDCPAVLIGADTSIISKYTDGFVIVVRSAKTTKDMLGDAIKYIKASNGYIIGAVMTDVHLKDKKLPYYG